MLRPYNVLSNSEKHMIGVGRAICEAVAETRMLDPLQEYTSISNSK